MVERTVIAKTLLFGTLLLGLGAHPLQTEVKPKPGNSQQGGRRTINGAQVMDIRLSGPDKAKTVQLKLQGDGASDLDCDIVELRGSEQASFGVNDHTTGDSCVLSWEWEPDVRYDLRITNHGKKANTFSFRLSFE